MIKSPLSIWGLRGSSRSIWNRARDRSPFTDAQAHALARAIRAAAEAAYDDACDYTDDEIRSIRQDMPDDLSGTIADVERQCSNLADDVNRIENRVSDLEEEVRLIP